MKRDLILLAAAAVIATAGAAPITPEQALQRAQTNAPARAKALTQTELKLVHTTKTAAGEAAAYVFSKDGKSGFSILSANDIAAPILGYSDSGSFDPQNMPPALTWWLDQYAAEIEYAESKGADTANAKMYAPSSWPAIEPMIKTKWNQDSPYSDQCPTSGGVVCPTGCVATAMAQVMNYFQYPKQAEGSISYKWGTRTLLMDFTKKEFDWDNMLDAYVSGEYTDDQASAISYLMKACGYSVEMSYSASASGTNSYKIPHAFTTYFKYDDKVNYYSRDLYNYDVWAEMCYDNLKNIGPFIYDGIDPIAGGHSFVCDGYDGAGYFHINWGWGGMSDGYFALDALTPVSQGAGGAEGGFNYMQDAIFGIQLPDGKDVEATQPQLTQYGTTHVYLSGSDIYFDTTDHYLPGWVNRNYDSMIFNLGVIIEPVNGGTSQTVQGNYGSSSYRQTLQGFTMLPRAYGLPNAKLPTLADGTYKVTLATKIYGDEWTDFVPVKTYDGYPNYALLTVSNGQYTVENVDPEVLQFKSVELTSPLYRDRNARLKAHIVNPYDRQLTACISPHLDLNGVTQQTAECILVTVGANTELDYEWVAHFYDTEGAEAYTDPTTYELTIYNENNHTSYGSFGNVEMTSTSSNYTLKSDTFVVKDVEKQASVTVDGQSYRNVYVVEDPENFTVDFAYHVSRGYFDSTIMLCLYRRSSDGVVYTPVTDVLWESTPFLGTDETESVELPISFNEAENDKVYYLRAEYMRGGAQTYLNQISITFPSESAVEDIIPDSTSAPVEYYNLQGLKISNPESGQLLIKRQGAKSTKVVY
jgi:hypothetical protein